MKRGDLIRIPMYSKVLFISDDGKWASIRGPITGERISVAIDKCHIVKSPPPGTSIMGVSCLAKAETGMFTFQEEPEK